MKNSVILIVGTRPEGIKMAPVYFALKNLGLNVLLCSTFQHTELLLDVFDLFGIKPDFNLSVMQKNQDLFHVTETVLAKTKLIFQEVKPSLILVQGDTTSAMSAALSAFYLNIPVGHIEAGLRSNNIYSPFPEEMNRKFISIISKYNFAPTEQAINNLLSSGINSNTIFYTGNTITDSLRIIKEKINNKVLEINYNLKQKIYQAKSNNKKIILLTMHRRESFSGGILEVLKTIKIFAQNNSNVIFFYPIHLNPNVIKVVEDLDLKNINNILIFDPLKYQDLVYLLIHADCVATDSGGIQEEATSLGKPIIILRNESDRLESISVGIAKLVGYNSEKIISSINNFLFQDNKVDKNIYENIYGDGYVADKIAKIVFNELMYM